MPLPILEVETGHVVSGSMVSRAYLVDSWSGLLAKSPDGRLWLVSTQQVLAPDRDLMLRRGEEAGGPPVASAKLTLTKIKMAWTDGMGGTDSTGTAEVPNPKLAKRAIGNGLVVVSLERAKGLAEVIERGILEGGGPVPYSVQADSHNLSVPDPGTNPFLIAGFYSDKNGGRWATTNTALAASGLRSNFAGVEGGIALECRLKQSQAGSPVYRTVEDGVVLAGLASPLRPGLAVLIPVSQVDEAVLVASQTTPPGRRVS